MLIKLDEAIVRQKRRKRLKDCPVGLFYSGDTLCMKTEYGNNEGRIDAFIVSSGEFFWGKPPQTIASQREQMVTPCNIVALPTVSDGWEDISSAPTNGTEILLYTDTSKSDAETQSYVEAICEGEHVKRIQMGYWCVLQGKWEKPIIGDPIFWRPLPAPPSE